MVRSAETLKAGTLPDSLRFTGADPSAFGEGAVRTRLHLQNGQVRVRTYGYPSLPGQSIRSPQAQTKRRGTRPPPGKRILEDLPALTVNGQNAGSRFARAVGLRPAISQTHRIRVPHDLLEVERVYAGPIPTHSLTAERPVVVRPRRAGDGCVGLRSDLPRSRLLNVCRLARDPGSGNGEPVATSAHTPARLPSFVDRPRPCAHWS